MTVRDARTAPAAAAGLPTRRAAPDRERTSLAERYARMAHDVRARGRSTPCCGPLDIVIAGAAACRAPRPCSRSCALAVLLTSGRPVLYRGARVGRGGRDVPRCTSSARCARTPRRGSARYLGEELDQLHARRDDARRARACAPRSSTSCRSSGTSCAATCRSSARARSGPVFFEELCEEIPQYWQRLVVRPGITGFAQLRMARDMTWAEKLAHDLEYIADRSVGLYLRRRRAPPWRVLSDVAARAPAARGTR